VSYGPAGDEKVVARDVQANDLVLTRSGAIYFVDTAQKSVGYIDAKGQRRVVYSGGDIMSPTALTLTPDQAMLLVADGMDRISGRFRSRGRLVVNGEPFQRLKCPKKDCSGRRRSDGRLSVYVGGQRHGYSGASNRAAARTF
jgi:sugar lactone lactonase YvrE